ncbi:MAG: ATP-binding protein [Myxococcales bacterium]|nr:ATP-binding protein [Myxococcales bacterium]
MSEPRLRRIDARPATLDVADYRNLMAPQGERPPPEADACADELVQLCRFRNRPAILRNNLRFGRGLLALRASDLDGDGYNELLVVDSDHTIHTLRYQPDRLEGWGPSWIAGAHRYRGRLLGLSYTGFGVFDRQEAIVISAEEHPEGTRYHELKLTCDGTNWDVSELVYRRAPEDEGELLLIGDSSEAGRVPVLRSRSGRMVVDVLDDRQGRGRIGGRRPPLAELSDEATALVLCEDELVVALASGGLLRISREGRQRPLLFPRWRFTCLAYAPAALGGRGGPEGGLLCGGTSFGYVFAIDLQRGGVLWRMDAGFLFSCMALADVESAGRVDLLLGGMDGGLRIYELTDSAALEQRCHQRYLALGPQAEQALQRRAPPGHEAHPPVQLYLLSRILQGQSPAHEATLHLVRWFTLGEPGWHMLPEPAQREAVAMLERYLVSHLPLLAGLSPEVQSSITGPLPLLTLEELCDPQLRTHLASAILGELGDIYLAAPRLVRRQIDRISRRLMGQMPPGLGGDEAGLGGQLQRLLNVRGLRAREYAHTLAQEAEAMLRRNEALPATERGATGSGSDVLMRVLRAIGLLEEAHRDRLSMEYERLDLDHAVFEPPALGAPHGGLPRGPSWVAGITRSGMLRIERVPAPGEPGGESAARLGPAHEVYLSGKIRFLEARRLLDDGGAALVVGLEEPEGTRLLLFALGRGGVALRSETLVPSGVEAIGWDLVPRGPGEELGEVLVLRLPPGGARDLPRVLAVDAPQGRLRVREDILSHDLRCVTATAAASLHVTAACIQWRGRGKGDPPLCTVPTLTPLPARCCALSADGRTAAIGTASGVVQVFAVVETGPSAALILRGQHLLPKGVRSLCFVPEGVFGMPALAVGVEDEQVHLFAVDSAHAGLPLARLAVGGAPERLMCQPVLARALAGDGDVTTVPWGYRMTLTLRGGVAAAWDAPQQAVETQAIERLLELAVRAAGSRREALLGALRGPSPHARAVAMRAILADARRGSWEPGAAGPGTVLDLIATLLGEPDGQSGRPAADWRPPPERHATVLSVLCEELVPMALGPTRVPDPHDPCHIRQARELLRQVVQQCDDPLAIRAVLLAVVERHVRPDQVSDLLGWLPQMVLHDSRSATWPFSTDSVGALFLQHLKRLDHVGIFDDAEPEFFRNVAMVLEATAPSMPSRFLLTEVALLLRSALSWTPAEWAGNLGRARLYLPHSAIEAMCHPALIPDAEARNFLLGVSRRWGPRLPMIGNEEGDETGPGLTGDEPEVDWWLEVAIESGFDELYYERLADELTRFTRPAAPGEMEPDAWELADTVQAVLRLFDVGNLTELIASLQPAYAARSLEAIRSHRGQHHRGSAHRYRDEAWAFLDEASYERERSQLLDDLLKLDRRVSKTRLALALDEVAAQLDRRRNKLRTQIMARLASPGAGAPGLRGPVEPSAQPTGDYAGRLLAVRPMATVVALMSAWWRALVDEASRLRTEADFEVRLVADLGVHDGRRVLRFAVVLSPDTTRPARDVTLVVRRCDPPEVRARPDITSPMDLEVGRELPLLLECPAHVAADGLHYQVEMELRHDDGKHTELVLQGQISRDSRQRARALFDGFSEQLPTVFQARVKQLRELLEPQGASVGLVTAFPAHGYEVLAEALGLEWPDRPVDSFGSWRMINLAARNPSTGTHLSGAGAPPLRDVLQQIGLRLAAALGIEGLERIDTAEGLVRAMAEAAPPLSAEGEPRGLLILGLPDLADRSRLGEGEQRQLLALGPQLCTAFRGRSLVLLSPQAAALALGEATAGRLSAPLELLDLDYVADPHSQGRQEEKARAELERALSALLSQGVGQAVPGLAAAVQVLIDGSGTDLRLVAECLPVFQEAMRDRAPRPPGLGVMEGRVGNYLGPVWDALPLPHRLYLAALSADTVELDVADLQPGMVVDAPVHSISGRDRLPTSKIVVAAGVRLDARAVEDLSKVMWLRKVRLRGSLHESRSVLWTYLRQSRPRPLSPQGREQRWLDLAAMDLRRLGLVRTVRLSGDRQLACFTSPAVREWLRKLLGLSEGEVGLPGTVDGRNLVRQLPLWDAASVDRLLGGNSPQLKAVLGWSRSPSSPGSMRWPDFLDLSRSCRRWVDGQDEPRFLDAVCRYFRLDPLPGTLREQREGQGPVTMRSVQIRFRDQQQLPWLKRVVLYLPNRQPDRRMLDEVQMDLRARLPASGTGQSGPHYLQRTDSAHSSAEWTVSDTALSGIVIVPELTPEIASWSRNLFHVAVIDVADLQHAALHEHPVEELIRRLAAAASYAALSPFRSKMGLANQELIEEMFYGRRALLEEIRGQRHENFLIVGPRKIGKTSLLQRVRFELEQQGYRVIPRGMDYTTAPDSRELLRAMIHELLEDLEPVRGAAGALHVQNALSAYFPPGGPRPTLRHVVDLWSQRHPDRSIAIVLDEIDTILRTERRAYMLGEWREAWTLGEALAGLLPQGRWPLSREALADLRTSLEQAGFTRDVVEGVIEGLQTDPQQRRPSPLLEELRSASALVLRGSAVCRVILAGHAELAEARLDLFGPLLNFAKLRFLGPLEEISAERMVREPFARLGLRFENQAAEQLLVNQTFRIPAWIQHCGALIIQSIDERLRSSRRQEQKITERDVSQALEQVYAEERAALQSENGLYMLGPECCFVLFALAEEGWFHVDFAVEFLRFWYESLDVQHRTAITSHEREYLEAFSPEAVRRIIRDLTNTFYLMSDEMAGQNAVSTLPPGSGRPEGTRERLRRSYRVSTPMVRAVFRDEVNLPKLVELARRSVRLYREGRGVWSRISSRPLQ